MYRPGEAAHRYQRVLVGTLSWGSAVVPTTAGRPRRGPGTSPGGDESTAATIGKVQGAGQTGQRAVRRPCVTIPRAFSAEPPRPHSGCAPDTPDSGCAPDTPGSRAYPS